MEAKRLTTEGDALSGGSGNDQAWVVLKGLRLLLERQ